MSSKLSEKTVAELPIPDGKPAWYPFAGHRVQGLLSPRGFNVRVLPSGHKAFVMRYRANGIDRALALGACGDWTVIRAIKHARDLRQRIDRGDDPLAEKKAARAPKVNGATIADLIDEYETGYLKAKTKDGTLRSADAIAHQLNRLARPRIGNIAIADLRVKPHIVGLLKEIGKDNGPVMADRLLSYLNSAFRWYATNGTHEFVAPEMVRLKQTSQDERARERVLEDAELVDVWHAVKGKGLSPGYAGVIRMLILSGQRRGEVSGLTWREISKDGSLWTLPAARAKNGREHLIPITPAMLAVMGERGRDSEFVFPGARAATQVAGFSKFKVVLDERITELRERAGRPPMESWNIHDLRRSCATGLQKLGVRLEVTEAVLNHISGSRSGVAGVYQRHDWANEKRAALEAWNTRVMALVEGLPASANVTAFPRQTAAA